ncbi:hypothetical protein N825_09405 [Skermanella stibiiresistens SB22]|uniref:SnoaL-like domain-containing protein n=2 Tax=Skermanella TaxID=204447 RepID=W9GZA2_9PROT|nr:hypothetical protein N825_09405 [Skermanella stibiiresistens SB22]
MILEKGEPSMRLPKPIETYIAAENTGDVDALSTCFAPNATVRDEGQVHHGLPAIKTWKAETKRKYNHTLKPLHSAERDGATIVTCEVTGDFPGSPVTLDFRFLLEAGLEGGAILSLETI